MRRGSSLRFLIISRPLTNPQTRVGEVQTGLGRPVRIQPITWAGRWRRLAEGSGACLQSHVKWGYALCWLHPNNSIDAQRRKRRRGRPTWRCLAPPESDLSLLDKSLALLAMSELEESVHGRHATSRQILVQHCRDFNSDSKSTNDTGDICDTAGWTTLAGVGVGVGLSPTLTSSSPL